MSDQTNFIEKEDVVVKFCGDSGDGMQLAGTLFSDAAALLLTLERTVTVIDGIFNVDLGPFTPDSDNNTIFDLFPNYLKEGFRSAHFVCKYRGME